MFFSKLDVNKSETRPSPATAGRHSPCYFLGRDSFDNHAFAARWHSSIGRAPPDTIVRQLTNDSWQTTAAVSRVSLMSLLPLHRFGELFNYSDVYRRVVFCSLTLLLGWRIDFDVIIRKAIGLERYLEYKIHSIIIIGITVYVSIITVDIIDQANFKGKKDYVYLNTLNYHITYFLNSFKTLS
jgi:hypothetical protein